MSYAYNRRKKNQKQMKSPRFRGLSLESFCEKKGISLPPKPELIGSVEQILVAFK